MTAVIMTANVSKNGKVLKALPNPSRVQRFSEWHGKTVITLHTVMNSIGMTKYPLKQKKKIIIVSR